MIIDREQTGGADTEMAIVRLSVSGLLLSRPDQMPTPIGKKRALGWKSALRKSLASALRNWTGHLGRRKKDGAPVGRQP